MTPARHPGCQDTSCTSLRTVSPVDPTPDTPPGSPTFWPPYTPPYSPEASTNPSPNQSPEPVTKTPKLEETENITAKSCGIKIPSTLWNRKHNTAQNMNSLISIAEKEAIQADKENVNLWDEGLAICEKKGRKEYVTQHFLCSICHEVAVGPATTACLHNYCLKCLKEGCKWNDNRDCPTCRLGNVRVTITINENMCRAIRTVFARYHAADYYGEDAQK
ncbi:unnamed protein product [Leptidea sinapis]|uniref:RING-type domain-containing protein n=1 Tax=Leptidea sinapis TaxID=189913 RepID=A0A5E4QTK5_9NEOP|nr:unnamed protein product [Leptidea sinapis]